MSKKKLSQFIIMLAFSCSPCLAGIKAICIKSARAGQDQKLAGHYHVSYATADDYHCYFAFDPADVEWISLRNFRKRPDLAKLSFLPSYQAFLVLFVNSSYQGVIKALKLRGKTVKEIRAIAAAAGANLITCKSARDAKNFLSRL